MSYKVGEDEYNGYNGYKEDGDDDNVMESERVFVRSK